MTSNCNILWDIINHSDNLIMDENNSPRHQLWELRFCCNSIPYIVIRTPLLDCCSCLHFCCFLCWKCHLSWFCTFTWSSTSIVSHKVDILNEWAKSCMNISCLHCKIYILKFSLVHLCFLPGWHTGWYHTWVTCPMYVSYCILRHERCQALIIHKFVIIMVILELLASSHALDSLACDDIVCSPTISTILSSHSKKDELPERILLPVFGSKIYL